jgi:multidrug resistance efflux pump
MKAQLDKRDLDRIEKQLILAHKRLDRFEPLAQQNAILRKENEVLEKQVAEARADMLDILRQRGDEPTIPTRAGRRKR